MRNLRGPLLNVLYGLWFVPGVIVLVYGGLAVVLVEIDRRTAVSGGPLFQGDAGAARTLLSVIAGSLITVAGLTFSITIVVLQLTSSQFSPRILGRFFADRLTQVTVGSFVGIFVYAIVVLRSVGGGDFVPRLSVTVASALAIAAVVLLIVFIHHVSQLIQVSYVTGDIARRTLARLDALYPSAQIDIDDVSDGDETLDGGSLEPPGLVQPELPGYVRRVDLDPLVEGLVEGIERVAVLVRPGDFVSVEQPLVALWPATLAADCTAAVRKACRVERERDLDQDVEFGVRQLVDTAVKAMSPGINDPTTACTCVGYVRSILVGLAARDFPSTVRHEPEHGITLVVCRREFDEYVESLGEIGRYSVHDPRVVAAVLDALRSICESADRAGFAPRAEVAAELANAVGLAARDAVSSERDRRHIESLLAAIPQAVRQNDHV